jgi:hypothetical protein
MSVVAAINPPVYSHVEAKKAYESGQRQFYVYPKYPLKRQRAETRMCDQCAEWCVLVHFDHRENGALVLKCQSCSARMEGGLYDVGIRARVASRDRLFSVQTREEIFKRDSVRCWRCGAVPESDELEADHIIPHALGGPTELLNGITLCKSCNCAKSAGYDEEFVTGALVYTHRKFMGITSGGTKATFSVLRSVATSLINWGMQTK